LRVVGRVSAIHGRVVDNEGIETRERVPRLMELMQGYFANPSKGLRLKEEKN
jgi:hypothetical protein